MKKIFGIYLTDSHGTLNNLLFISIFLFILQNGKKKNFNKKNIGKKSILRLYMQVYYWTFSKNIKCILYLFLQMCDWGLFYVFMLSFCRATSFIYVYLLRSHCKWRQSGSMFVHAFANKVFLKISAEEEGFQPPTEVNWRRHLTFGIRFIWAIWV